ncbi:hypothetical protein KFK09_023581 [Dendrobium nobile]|uniref:Uncharacterized protein n=1 Tax=Dendrobium nobile TaxID=94219 RepID=A0A8T3ABN6_DENNO|nr:hypothetical protein KFK09_023581 [Dendrobium nobile]
MGLRTCPLKLISTTIWVITDSKIHNFLAFALLGFSLAPSRRRCPLLSLPVTSSEKFSISLFAFYSAFWLLISFDSSTSGLLSMNGVGVILVVGSIRVYLLVVAVWFGGYVLGVGRWVWVDVCSVFGLARVLGWGSAGFSDARLVASRGTVLTRTRHIDHRVALVHLLQWDSVGQRTLQQPHQAQLNDWGELCTCRKHIILDVNKLDKDDSDLPPFSIYLKFPPVGISDFFIILSEKLFCADAKQNSTSGCRSTERYQAAVLSSTEPRYNKNVT